MLIKKKNVRLLKVREFHETPDEVDETEEDDGDEGTEEGADETSTDAPTEE